MNSKQKQYSEIADLAISLAADQKPEKNSIDDLAKLCECLEFEVKPIGQKNEIERLLNNSLEVVRIQLSRIEGSLSIYDEIELGEIVCYGLLGHSGEWAMAADLFTSLLTKTNDKQIQAYLYYRLAEIRLGDTPCLINSDRFQQAVKSVLRPDEAMESHTNKIYRCIADEWLNHLESPVNYLKNAIKLEAGMYSTKAKFKLAMMYYFGDTLLRVDKSNAKVLLEDVLSEGPYKDIDYKKARGILAEMLQKPSASEFDLSRAAALYKEAITEYENENLLSLMAQEDMYIYKYNLAGLLNRSNLPDCSPHEACLLYEEVSKSQFDGVAAMAKCDQSVAYATGAMEVKKNKSMAKRIAKSVRNLDDKGNKDDMSRTL